MADHLWLQYRDSVKENESLAIYFASFKSDPLEVVINHRPGTYYNSDYYRYDQYTGNELPAPGSYSGKFKDAN